MNKINNISDKRDRSKWPVLAICYDFDKTLSPRNMQEFGLIQDLGYEDSPEGYKQFWTNVNKLAKQSNMDQYLASMCFTIQEMYRNHKSVSADLLKKHGESVELYDGVSTWFDRIRNYGERHNVLVEHYIISAGFREMLSGVRVTKNKLLEETVTRIYASSFYFEESGTRVWPSRVIDATGKTRILFRIKKNILDESDPAVHDPVPKSRVPFRNMVYIGDSETDVPCMKIVRERGGLSIGVYDPQTADNKRILEIMKAGRISFYAPADYTKGSKIERLLKLVVDRVEKEAALSASQDDMDAEFNKAIQRLDASKAKADVSIEKPSAELIKKHVDKYEIFASPALLTKVNGAWMGDVSEFIRGYPDYHVMMRVLSRYFEIRHSRAL